MITLSTTTVLVCNNTLWDVLTLMNVSTLLHSLNDRNVTDANRKYYIRNIGERTGRIFLNQVYLILPVPLLYIDSSPKLFSIQMSILSNFIFHTLTLCYCAKLNCHFSSFANFKNVTNNRKYLNMTSLHVQKKTIQRTDDLQVLRQVHTCTRIASACTAHHPIFMETAKLAQLSRSDYTPRSM